MFYFRDLTIIPKCSSTHEKLKQNLLRQEHFWGTALMTIHQTDGKGLLGTKWEAQKFNSLCISYAFEFNNTDTKSIHSLSMCCALAVHELIIKFVDSSKVFIKWPNDIVVFDGCNYKKISGILIEQLDLLQSKGFLLGIGININQQKFDMDKAVSLYMVSGKHESILELAHLLTFYLENYLHMLKKNQLDKICTLYTRKLLGYGEKRKFLMAKNTFEAVLLGVNDFGELCLLVNDKLQAFKTKDLVWVL
jgi:BirA family biotin operon repressor/biotin-[acetyl-CoA-carboxylase] ligase